MYVAYLPLGAKTVIFFNSFEEPSTSADRSDACSLKALVSDGHQFFKSYLCAVWWWVSLSTNSNRPPTIVSLAYCAHIRHECDGVFMQPYVPQKCRHVACVHVGKVQGVDRVSA